MSGREELEDLLLSEGSRDSRSRSRERLRHDEGARALYDDYFLALREIAAGDLDASDPNDTPLPSCSPEEAAWLHAGFFESWSPESAAASESLHAELPSTVQRWFARLVAAGPWLALAAALVLVWFVGRGEERRTDDEAPTVARNQEDPGRAPEEGARAYGSGTGLGLVARGRGRSAELELELFCGRPPRPVNDERCQLDDTLSFAFRPTARSTGDRVLSIFGVDAEGRVQYYLPTPAASDGASVPAGDSLDWRALDFSVDLSVNHGVGDVHLFALLGPRVATVEEIDELAAALEDPAALTSASRPWLDDPSLSHAPVVRGLCPDAEACEGVQVRLQLTDGSSIPAESDLPTPDPQVGDLP